MNVESEAAERKAAFELSLAIAGAERAGDVVAKTRAEATIYPDYDNAVACLPYLHPKLSNVTIEEDKASAEEVEASFNAIVGKLDATAAKKAVTFIPPDDAKVTDLSTRVRNDENK